MEGGFGFKFKFKFKFKKNLSELCVSAVKSVHRRGAEPPSLKLRRTRREGWPRRSGALQKVGDRGSWWPVGGRILDG